MTRKHRVAKATTQERLLSQLLNTAALLTGGYGVCAKNDYRPRGHSELPPREQ